MNRIIKTTIGLFPLKNTILFESRPDLSDNTKAVFDALVAQGWNQKYQMIWMISDRNSDVSELVGLKNVSYVYRNDKTKRDKFAFLYYLLRAKLIIGCNDFLPKQISKQKYIHLAHGCALKKTEYYHLPEGIDKVVTVSDFMKKYDAINYNCAESKFIVTGYPRCDDLFVNRDLHALFDIKFDKVILWLPTFRQSKRNGGTCHSSISFPIIRRTDDAVKLNEFCKSRNTLIVVKAHPNQDMDLISDLQLSHLKFISDSFFKEKGMTLYQFMGNCDALLSDYSSVYYDYLLCDKPIGLCWDDFDEYTKNNGFTLDPQVILAGGEKLFTLDDLIDFVADVCDGKDSLVEERERIKRTVHCFNDNRSTERVVQYIKDFLAT